MVHSRVQRFGCPFGTVLGDEAQSDTHQQDGDDDTAGVGEGDLLNFRNGNDVSGKVVVSIKVRVSKSGIGFDEAK